MGEILRAILDKNSAYNKVAFYTGTINSISPVTGAKTFVRRQTSIPCKIDTYFLAMGAAQFSFSTFGTAPKGEQSTFMVQRAANQENFSIAPQVRSNLNYNLNNWVTWDEYVLFEPGELITLIEDVQITDITFPLTHVTTVVLMGIEYKFPAGKGGLRRA